MDINDLELGKAGEHLVCLDLILKGFPAYLSDQGLSYDVVLDVDGKLLKIQVKTTGRQRPVPQREKYISGYLYHIKRMGKFGLQEYSKDAVDIFALVAMDIKTVAYLPYKQVRRTMILRSRKHFYPTNHGTFLEDLTIERALECLTLD